MEWYVGTSGYCYKEWKGRFYPADLPDRQMLHYYSGVFQSVEINNTFHRMPTVPLLDGWAGQVPDRFRFVLKAPQRITHQLRLLDADDAVSYLVDATGTLGPRLGALLFQLPPGLKKDLPRLRDFLALFPPGRLAAFEFRHPSWFDPEVYQLLQSHRAALCIAEAEGGLEVPVVATTDWGYLRLRLPEYTDDALRRWVHRLREQSWSRVFVFFKHEDEARGPELAQRFLALAGE